jgi:GH24 family phage-related lysozyme (muramidase)
MVRECITAKLLDCFTNREAVLVSFIYNGGQGWLCNPHHHPITYTTVARNINAGNYVAGCNAMKAYNKSNGRKRDGLVMRRKQEAALCMRND